MHYKKHLSLGGTVNRTTLLLSSPGGHHQGGDQPQPPPARPRQRDPGRVRGVQPPLRVPEEPGLLRRLPGDAGGARRRGDGPVRHPGLYHVL